MSALTAQCSESSYRVVPMAIVAAVTAMPLRHSGLVCGCTGEVSYGL